MPAGERHRVHEQPGVRGRRDAAPTSRSPARGMRRVSFWSMRAKYALPSVVHPEEVRVVGQLARRLPGTSAPARPAAPRPPRADRCPVRAAAHARARPVPARRRRGEGPPRGRPRERDSAGRCVTLPSARPPVTAQRPAPGRALRARPGPRSASPSRTAASFAGASTCRAHHEDVFGAHPPQRRRVLAQVVDRARFRRAPTAPTPGRPTSRSISAIVPTAYWRAASSSSALTGSTLIRPSS